VSKRKINGILIIYRHDYAPIASMVIEIVNAFPRYSQFKAWSVNTHLGFPEALRELEFGIVVLHYSLFGWRPFYLDDAFRAYLAESESSYKVAFFQDEYRWWPERAGVLNRFRVDCVYTCIEPPYYKDTYWKYTKVPRVETYLPGYVDEEMLQHARDTIKPDEERTIDIGYRGRRSFGYMGKGAREKEEIGVRFREMAAGEGLVLDIETEEHKRIYGKHWLDFLGNCRALLGVEAGVSIFDIDNKIFSRYERFRGQDQDERFEQAYEDLLEKYDGKGIYYRTVSPRVFEAAAVRACQILYEGRYSGILEPMVHYIPLKKDFSNFHDVIRLYRDARLRRELTECCYRDLIASGAYSYRRFIEKFDAGLAAMGLEPAIAENTAHQVNRLLADSEQSLLLKYVETQRVKHRELSRRHRALQTQCVELQRHVLHLLSQDPALKARYGDSQVLMAVRLETLVAEVTDRQASDLPADHEECPPVKKVEAQQLEYQELLNRKITLRQCYAEMQRQLLEMLDRHPAMKVRWLVSQGLKIAALLGKREFLAARVYIANTLLPYSALRRLADSVVRVLQ
jgi:hypothetical protein